MAAEEPLSLEQAISIASSANRSLAAARLGREVSQAGVDIAGQRPNPEFTFESSLETPHESYAFALPIEIGGKRQRRLDVSRAATGGDEAEISRLIEETRVSVRRAYFTLSAAQRRVKEMEEVLGLAQRTSDAAGGRFESGAAPRLEVVQAKMNFEQTNNDLGAAQAELTSARIDLNTLLARPPDASTTAAEDIDAGEVPDPARALDLAMTASAELSVVDRRIDAEQARVGLARAERIPDLVLQGAITRRAQPEFDTGWRAGFSIELPLLNRHHGEVRLEEGTLAQLQAEREAVVARIRGSVSAALVVATGLHDQLVRYHDLILPEAAEVQEMAAESYRSGQTGLVTMLQAFASVRDVRLKAVQAGLDFQIALAELELAIGAPLP
ncbi:MAG TPA: TolC family protein [Patescibacteria group bacterium]|jgi:cobalt-zinc-cadmium efflux system outer membrane protein|nr:TolC family protein [Patescibacteria group bacterium]